MQYPEPGVIYQDITADNGNIVGDQYVFETAMPMVMTRKYTNLFVGTCDSRYVETFNIMPSTDGKCKDRYYALPYAACSMRILYSCIVHGLRGRYIVLQLAPR